MELIDIIPVFNLYEEFWKIYTEQSDSTTVYIISDALLKRVLQVTEVRYTEKYIIL